MVILLSWLSPIQVLREENLQLKRTRHRRKRTLCQLRSIFLCHADRRVFQTVCDQINKTVLALVDERDVAGQS